MLDSEFVRQTADALRTFVEKAASAHPETEVEVCAIISESDFIRLARSAIIQSQADETARVSVRVISGKMTGVAVTSSLASEALERALEEALSMARVMPPREEAGLPEEPHRRTHYAEDLDLPSSQDKFKQVATLFAIAAGVGCRLSGSYETSIQALIVANSRGTLCVQVAPRVSIQLIAERGEATGYGSYLAARYASDLVAAQLERAIAKASWEEKPLRIEPGEYAVILEPEAVAAFLDVMSLFSFGGRHVLEGRSFVSDVKGQMLFPETLTIVDNARHPDQLVQYFDFEGVPKKSTPLIEKGTVVGAVYDTETARLAGTRSTGHALPLPNPHGPAPSHLVVEPGTASPDELIARLGSGILITRFHYVNIEDPKRAVLTGMTRDGTFLVENGEVVAPLIDLRFTQNAVDALKSLQGIAHDTRLCQPGFAQVVTPSLAFGNFRITGTKSG